MPHDTSWKRQTLLGVVGTPLGHSQSPAMFQRRFASLGRNDLDYQAYEFKSIDEVATWMTSTPTLKGFNVTLPFKQSIMSFLDALSPEAKEVGAVNTVVRQGDLWVGYNTDVWGFQRAIQPFLAMRHERALVLGTGGSAAAVHHALKGLGIEAVSVSRGVHAKDMVDGGSRPLAWGRPVIGYDELSSWTFQHHLLLIQCTPVGMYPHVEACPPIPTEFLGPDHLVVDLIYNPSQTELLRRARNQGALTLNGADMLRLQADRAWEIWSAAGA